MSMALHSAYRREDPLPARKTQASPDAGRRLGLACGGR